MEFRWARFALLGFVALVLAAVMVFVVFGMASPEEDLGVISDGNGETHHITLVPVTPLDAPTSSSPRGFSIDEELPEGVPPESTLGHRRQAVTSTGELLSAWRRDDLFAGDAYPSFPASRSERDLPLSDGNLLSVPRGAALRFDYGGEIDFNRTIFDVLVFEVVEGELLREDLSGQLMVLKGASPERGMPDRRRPVRALIPPFQGPESLDGEARIDMNVPPGVYVVSVSVSTTEGDARYNFRVEVEEDEEAG